MFFFKSFFSILYLILYHVHCFIGVPLPLHSLISIYLYIYLQIYTRGEARLYARPQYILPVKKRVNALSEVDVRQFHTIKKKKKKIRNFLRCRIQDSVGQPPSPTSLSLPPSLSLHKVSCVMLGQPRSASVCGRWHREGVRGEGGEGGGLSPDYGWILVQVLGCLSIYFVD